MPLDDIFYEKSTKSAAKKLEFFWQWCTISLGGIVSVVALFYDFSFLLIFLVVWVAPVFIAYSCSKLFSTIPYYDFSEKERENIYFYIIASVLFLIYLILLLVVVL